MAISPRLKAFLVKYKIKHKLQKHPVAYTAQEIAAEEHVPGRQLAKCVLVTMDKGMALAVLPATQLVNLAKLKRVLKTKKAALARESDVKRAFPDIEVGAMSVFGNLYDIPVVVDRTLAEAAEIVCNAGTHTDTVKLRYKDFEKFAKPKVGLFTASFATAQKKKPKRRKAS